MDNVKEDEKDTTPLYDGPLPESSSDPKTLHTVLVDNVNFDDVQKRILLCTENEGTHTIKSSVHDLWHLRNHGHAHFHYTFHLYFNNKHYFFESSERRGAAIVLSELAEMKQIHKHIELLDLSIRLVFHIRHMKIKQVDMRVYLLSDGLNVDDKSQYARTVFVDKENNRHHLYSESQCDALWEKHPSLQHPMAFRCKTDTEKTPRDVMVDGAQLPPKCPYNATSGELHLPRPLQNNKDLRIQANHCYRNWMHAQRHRHRHHRSSATRQSTNPQHPRTSKHPHTKKKSLREKMMVGKIFKSTSNSKPNNQTR
jgi:hypothetical protein